MTTLEIDLERRVIRK